ncbi:MAG: hypothetical protein ACI9LE_002158 [Paraglaciecola sp.]|jgi:hypothetical protein
MLEKVGHKVQIKGLDSGLQGIHIIDGVLIVGAASERSGVAAEL